MFVFVLSAYRRSRRDANRKGWFVQSCRSIYILINFVLGTIFVQGLINKYQRLKSIFQNTSSVFAYTSTCRINKKNEMQIGIYNSRTHTRRVNTRNVPHTSDLDANFSSYIRNTRAKSQRQCNVASICNGAVCIHIYSFRSSRRAYILLYWCDRFYVHYIYVCLCVNGLLCIHIVVCVGVYIVRWVWGALCPVDADDIISARLLSIRAPFLMGRGRAIRAARHIVCCETCGEDFPPIDRPLISARWPSPHI